jgi:hypothetical protein
MRTEMLFTEILERYLNGEALDDLLQERTYQKVSKSVMAKASRLRARHFSRSRRRTAARKGARRRGLITTAKRRRRLTARYTRPGFRRTG